MMEPFWVGILGIVLLIVLLFLEVYIGIALAVSGFIGLSVLYGFDTAAKMVAGGIYHRLASWDLMVLPLFVLMGLLAASGGVSTNIYKALRQWLGGLRGGLGIATTVASAVFGTVSGSCAVNAVVFSKISAPEMRRHGYDKRCAYGITASAGAIGMLIPPSILMVVYGSLSGDSIGKLLIGGTVPGLVLTITISLAILILSYVKPSWIPAGVLSERFTWHQRLASIPSFWPVIIVGAVIFGGIFTGIFSPTEAGAVATSVVLILFFIVEHHQPLLLLRNSLRETAAISGMIFLIFAGATIFSHFLTLSGVSDRILSGLLSIPLSNPGLVILLAFLFVVMGCFLDGISICCITVPILVPAIRALGITSIYFAMVAVTAMHVGPITPPVGIDVFVAKGVAEPDVSVGDIFVGTVPFLIATLVTVGIIMAFPELSLFLPRLTGRG
jgi:C4-dicarboxylate transporter DctM subunit